MFFTYAIEITVIAMGAMMALDIGTRIATAYMSAVTGRTTASGAITPAPQDDEPQRPTAPAEYVVEYVGYYGDTRTIAPAPVAVAMVVDDTSPKVKRESRSTLADMMRSEAARPKDGIVERLDHTFNLPDTIRGLRQYVRDNNLQKHVKTYTGKTVSRATKAELLEALANI